MEGRENRSESCFSLVAKENEKEKGEESERIFSCRNFDLQSTMRELTGLKQHYLAQGSDCKS